MMVISQDKTLVANFERNIWQADGKGIYLISVEEPNDNFLEFAKYETKEEAVKQLGFMVEGAIRGFVTYEFK